MALAKIELVFPMKKKIETHAPTIVGTEAIQIGNKVKYLEVILDTKMTFSPHILNVTDKAILKICVEQTYAQNRRFLG